MTENEKKPDTTRPDSFGSFFRNLSGHGNDGNAQMYLLMIDMYKEQLAAQREELKSLREENMQLREKKSDVQDEIEKALSLAKLVKGGDNPWLEAAKQFGPALMEKLEGIGKAMMMSKMQGRIKSNPQQATSKPPAGAQAQPSQPSQLPEPYMTLLKELHGMIMADNKNYPVVSQNILFLFNGDDEVLKNLALGAITHEQIIGLLCDSYEPFKTDSALRGKLGEFIAGFVNFLRQGPYKNLVQQAPAQTQSAPQTDAPMEAPANANILYGRCAVCGTEFEYPDKQAYEDDEKSCDNMLQDGPCPGKIELITN